MLTDAARVAAAVLATKITHGQVASPFILEASPNREGGIAFLSFLLSPESREILQEHGLPLIRPLLQGDKALMTLRSGHRANSLPNRWAYAR